MTDVAEARRGRSLFASLEVRNFRLYWAGQMVSGLGTWLSFTAMSWLVLTDLDGGGTEVGFLAACQFLPTLVLGTYAGVLADRTDLRRLLVVTQSALVGIGVVMAALAAAGSFELWMVFLLVGLQGIATAVHNPARQAFVSELVNADLIANAIALNAASFNSARIIGPAVAGLLIEVSGTGVCFLLNAVSYGAAIGALLAMRRDELHHRAELVRAKGQVRAGMRYVAEVPVLRAALIAMAVVGTVSMNFTVLVPLFARTTFDTGASTFGLLSMSMGGGSLVGSLYAASVEEPTLTQLGRGAIALGVAMFACAAAPSLPIAMVAIGLAGACMMTFTAAMNGVLQVNARPDMRGRVLSLYIVLFIGTSPVGSPIVGWIAETFSTRGAFVYGGLGAVAGGVLALRGRRTATERTTAPLGPDASALAPETSAGSA